MNKFKVRPATAEDIPAFIEYMKANASRNEFDPSVMEYPTTRVLAVDEEIGTPVLFLPVTVTLMMDALAPRPGLSNFRKGEAMRKCVIELLDRVKEMGIGEIHFLSNDQSTIDFAKAHGFEELDTKILRLKPKDWSPVKKVI